MKTLIALLLLILCSCGSEKESSDNRNAFEITIENASRSDFICDYIKYNENYQYIVNQDKYEVENKNIPAGATLKLIAYTREKNSDICEIILILGEQKKGIIFFKNDSNRYYKILPGYLGAAGTG